MKQSLTPAPLMSLIITKVYNYFDIDLEADRVSNNEVLAKKICCYITLDIIIGNKVREICKPLHITSSNYYKYIDSITDLRGTDKQLNDSINSIKLNVLTEDLMHDKYKQFLSSASKRTNINYLQIQN